MIFILQIIKRGLTVKCWQHRNGYSKLTRVGVLDSLTQALINNNSPGPIVKYGRMDFKYLVELNGWSS